MINIAILGLGVVGGGVYEALKTNAALISEKLGGQGINVAHVLDRRSFAGHELQSRVTADFDRILSDKSVAVVVETLGGAEPAFTFSLKALKAGKSVVTSNKEVVAKYADVLLKAAKDSGTCYLYEASVGGGIPIVASLAGSLTANKITRIAGILNGTTNYILTQMLCRGASFESALADAQSKGYAERDPSDDVNGVDALRKICILAGIASGRHIPTESAALCRGIADIKAEDVAAADRAGYAVKLLGVAKFCGGHAGIVVAPHLVRKGTLLADTAGVFNAVSVTGNLADELVFYGRGAGGVPTASAIVADLITALRSPVPEATRERAEDGFALPLGAIPVRLFLRTSSPAQLCAPFGEVTELGGGERAVVTVEAPCGQHTASIERAGVEVLSRHFVL